MILTFTYRKHAFLPQWHAFACKIQQIPGFDGLKDVPDFVYATLSSKRDQATPPSYGDIIAYWQAVDGCEGASKALSLTTARADGYG